MWEQFIEDWEKAKAEAKAEVAAMKYKGIVTYQANDGRCVYECNGFDKVADATKWIADRFAYLMLHWADIDENGIIVWGEVTNVTNGISYSDGYELHCGC